MAFRNKRVRRLVLRVLPITVALVVLLVSLILVSNVQQDASGLNQPYVWVLVLTVFALLVVTAAIFHRVISLTKKVREHAPGAMLSARWVRYFLVLSLPPALIVYFFSAYFLTQTVDSWFDVGVESALADSLELGQQFLENRTLEVRNQVRRLTREIDNPGDDADAVRTTLLANVSASGPLELSVMEGDGRMLASANINMLADLPERPGDYALLQALDRGEYAVAEPMADGILKIRVIQRLPFNVPGGQGYLLQAIYPLPESITTLASEIEREYHRYQNLSFLREPLKQSFILILSLVLLLTVLLAILAALNVSRKLVSPISKLAQATREIAAGDLTYAIQAETRDELGFLVQSFNEMTEALTSASTEAELSRAQLQSQSEYLETVLGSLTAGVLTLDNDLNIVTANVAAEEVLGMPGGFFAGQALPERAESAPVLAPLAELIEYQMKRGPAEWQREIRLQAHGQTKILLVRGSRLSGEVSQAGGAVIVFDDVTMLNQAQREAAWAEVARRLAHEVKNPLTPIRLAAERLRMKLMSQLAEQDRSILERATGTIVSQVESLRSLVDAFGDYAQGPQLERKPIVFDELIKDVVALYQHEDQRVRFHLKLIAGPPGLSADGGQIRQLLHNLVVNSSEAVAEDKQAEVHIRTRLITQAGKKWLEMEVSDRGPGYPQAVLEKPFEPYVTFKAQGSGLGLAICRKIVSEHDGRITIHNPAAGGACTTIILPVGSPQ
ncbi:MAG: HAMP domain-containing protein [Xanthomonadales bacterium]|nr:HAMP domain-containing protein [Gammaproteobacteria bacterium]MBT8072909.1 HAMP domain-containing protein [Gammaproteobacteria bacterium]NNK03750.1 HAMP domain-containing protein [Xanthomonadales bacterium]NNK98852.1 HAMP domain-containing protein [Xanthomonadales bacterium]